MRKGRNLHCKYGDLTTTSKSEPEFPVRSNVPVGFWDPRTSSVFQDSSTSSKSLADISLLSRSSTKSRASSRSMSTCDTSTKLFTRSAIRFSVRLCANGKHQGSKNKRTVAQIFNLPRTASFIMFSLSFGAKTSSCTGSSPRTSRSTFPGLTDSIARRFTQEVIGGTE